MLKTDGGVKWESEGAGHFMTEFVAKETRGTEVHFVYNQGIVAQEFKQ